MKKYTITDKAGATYSQCHSTSLLRGNYGLKFDTHLANLGSYTFTVTMYL